MTTRQQPPFAWFSKRRVGAGAKRAFEDPDELPDEKSARGADVMATLSKIVEQNANPQRDSPRMAGVRDLPQTARIGRDLRPPQPPGPSEQQIRLTDPATRPRIQETSLYGSAPRAQSPQQQMMPASAGYLPTAYHIPTALSTSDDEHRAIESYLRLSSDNLWQFLTFIAGRLDYKMEWIFQLPSTDIYSKERLERIETATRSLEEKYGRRPSSPSPMQPVEPEGTAMEEEYVGPAEGTSTGPDKPPVKVKLESREDLTAELVTMRQRDVEFKEELARLSRLIQDTDERTRKASLVTPTTQDGLWQMMFSLVMQSQHANALTAVLRAEHEIHYKKKKFHEAVEKTGYAFLRPSVIAGISSALHEINNILISSARERMTVAVYPNCITLSDLMNDEFYASRDVIIIVRDCLAEIVAYQMRRSTFESWSRRRRPVIYAQENAAVTYNQAIHTLSRLKLEDEKINFARDRTEDMYDRERQAIDCLRSASAASIIQACGGTVEVPAYQLPYL